MPDSAQQSPGIDVKWTPASSVPELKAAWLAFDPHMRELVLISLREKKALLLEQESQRVMALGGKHVPGRYRKLMQAYLTACDLLQAAGPKDERQYRWQIVSVSART